MQDSDLQRSDHPATNVGQLTDLVRRAVEGDQTAWNAITERFTDLLWSVARSHRLSHSDAADVVQTTWLRLVEHLDRIREPERLAGWLAATARHECISLLRKAGRESVTWNGEEVQDRGGSVPSIDAALLEHERDAELWSGFLRLSERCQALLRVLMATDSTSYAEVSEAFGMPVGSIGPTRMRCLNRLRSILAESEYPFDVRGGDGS